MAVIPLLCENDSKFHKYLNFLKMKVFKLRYGNAIGVRGAVWCVSSITIPRGYLFSSLSIRLRKDKTKWTKTVKDTMASQSGMFLNREERASLVKELTNAGEKLPANLLQEAHIHGSSGDGAGESLGDFGTGCLSCGIDNDHANLLLCEGCNDEYHTYCLDPPLNAVPSGDWFCRKYSDFMHL